MSAGADSKSEIGDTELILVSYRSQTQISGLLTAFPADFPVAVVDNAGDVDGVSEVVNGRSNARYLDAGGIGFARAANLGARTSSHEYIVFGNPDSRPELADIERLVADVAADPHCASSAALLLGVDGKAELSGGWEPTLRRTIVHAMSLNKLFPLAGLFARPSVGSTINVDWTSAACMAVRRQTFLGLGGFDESFYVYSEDVAFGRTVRLSGLYQRLRTDIAVPHTSGGSGAPPLEMMRLRGASMARYVRKYDPYPLATAMIGVLILGYLVRVAEQLLGRDRPRAREHWAYVMGLVTRRAQVAGVEVLDG